MTCESYILHLLYLPYPLFLLKELGHTLFFKFNRLSVFSCEETSNLFPGCSVWIYFASFNLCGHLQSSKVLRILHRDLLLRRRVSQAEVKLLWRKLNIFANFLKYSNIKINNFLSLRQYLIFWQKFFSRAHLPYVAPTKYRQSSDYAAIVLGTSLLFTGLYLSCKFVLLSQGTGPCSWFCKASLQFIQKGLIPLTTVLVLILLGYCQGFNGPHERWWTKISHYYENSFSLSLKCNKCFNHMKKYEVIPKTLVREKGKSPKDAMNCPEKVMKISHFDQTNQRLLSILW